ncbi:MAG TPA: AarF/UbiB family protein [Dehalococcoidia bacterium]|nr:AarF/UbiB family protein [Dehalococcoidia bacterium]
MSVRALKAARVTLDAMPLPATRSRRPSRFGPRRFLNTGVTLARAFAGYKLISLLQGRKGEEWAEVRRHQHHRWSAQRIYDTAVRDQGMLIKTCQFLSSRPDVVPDEYIDVLSALQDEVPPEPIDVIRRVVEAELGKPLEAVFREFEPWPVASASLAQVHRAVLLDGSVVAVKVQYPGIDKLVEIDLRSMRRFIAILNRLDRTIDLSFIADEMGRMVPLELDFIHEGHNAEAIARNFAGVQDVVVPGIYWQHSTRRVLTMEYVEGVKITDVEGMRRQGIDTTDVAKVLVVAFSEMLLQHGLFHADPHPGNLLVAPGPKLVLVDFGQVKELGPQFRMLFGQMTKALVSEDDSALGRSFRDLGFRMKRDNDAGYVDLGNAYVGNIAKEMTANQAGWADPDMFRDSYRQMLQILRANPLIKIPPDLLFVGRVMGLLNGLSMTLRSRTNLLVEMARLLEEGALTGKRQANLAENRRLLQA